MFGYTAWYTHIWTNPYDGLMAQIRQSIMLYISQVVQLTKGSLFGEGPACQNCSTLAADEQTHCSNLIWPITPTTFGHPNTYPSQLACHHPGLKFMVQLPSSADRAQCLLYKFPFKTHRLPQSDLLCLCFSNLFLNITSCTSNLDAHLLRRSKDNLPCQLWLVWNGLIWAMVSMESCSWSCSPDIPLIWIVMGQHWNQSFGPTIETECQGDACTFHRRKIAIVGARKPRVWTWCQVRCFHDVDPTIYSHTPLFDYSLPILQMRMLYFFQANWLI